MRVIDCDAHVEESVETWQYLDLEFYLLANIIRGHEISIICGNIDVNETETTLRQSSG